ncbi:Nudix family hydrolase [Thioalkalivibrio sp. ALJ7]|uniref:Nudix family hydrolase n=1 Tax=Thioalkalivibrio sp. ALJ7 TaxID=1158756 RepID=UPI00037302F8|nr:Nudix family hydrolase [Thioalkalivibrio sp. ALJ7]
MPSTVPDPGAVPVEVAIGLILDATGRVLVTHRTQGRHLAGLWEFPGGKVDRDEQPAEALARELDEELGIRVESAVQCLTIPHRYAERTVRLHVFRVTEWSGQPEGREDQPLEWRDSTLLDPADFPAANRPMLQALTLPSRYLVTPSPDSAAEIASVVLDVANALRAARAGMVQVRAPALARDAYRQFLAAITAVADPLDIPVLANAPLEWLNGFDKVGSHLPERRWRALEARPLVPGRVAASVHDVAGLEAAASLGLDFAVLGPVRATATHPGAEPLGWERFGEWVRQSAIPVYALGAMDLGALPRAQAVGAQGIAAIRGLLGRR